MNADSRGENGDLPDLNPSAEEEVRIRQGLVLVALGRAPADRIIRVGRWLNVHTLHWESDWDIVIKGRRIAWPRIESATDLMVAGSARPLIDAFRIAHVELVEWLVADYGFEKLEAYQVLSQVGSARVANVVDPLYTVVARFPKALLPKREP